MGRNNPPQLPLRFFRWFCHPKLRDNIEGDLMELYEERKIKSGKWKSDLRFIVDVLLLFRPGIIKPTEGTHTLNTYGMYKSYFKIGWRNLFRNKAYTVINIAGLAMGITCCIILFLIVDHGRSYDKYHSKGDRIYRVVSMSKGNEGFKFTQGIPIALPFAFRDDFAQVDQVAFTSYRRGNTITVVEKDKLTKYEEKEGVAFTEPSFFKIFDRKILMGSADKGLDDISEALISRKWALKYFGREDVLGEIIEFESKPYKIMGVMEDVPTNTDLPFELVLSYATIKSEYEKGGWGHVSDSDNCYFLLKEGADISSVEQQIPAFVKKHQPESILAENETPYILQPLYSIHSDMRFGNYGKKLPVAAQIAFTVIALFLLISACINFVNLTTAEAVKRAREVGIRKVLGSTRKQLVSQFIVEALIVTIASIVISLFAADLLLGFINPFLNSSLVLNLFSQSIWIFLVTLIIVVITFAGFYPAWMVSGFNATLALKNLMGNKGSKGFSLRKGLVVLQFFISQFFIIGTIVMTRQMSFMQNQDIGFAKDAIITIPIPDQSENSPTSGSARQALKNEILRLPGVENVSLNYSPPSYNAVLTSSFSLAGSSQEFSTQVKQVDGNYIQLFQFELIAGELLADHDSMRNTVVNEKLARTIGFENSREIVGKEISLWGKNLLVTGVVKDFNTQSLSHAVEPVVLVNNASGFQSLSVKLVPYQMQATIEQIRSQWEAHYPGYIFSYEFIDEQIRNMYNGERKTTVLMNIFAFIAIFIGCLGLLGLVMFMTNQKTKEVGVRKVLGASVVSIVVLFLKEFAKPILIAFALSAPLAALLMNNVVDEFAYKTTIGPAIFFFSFLITFSIAFFTVGYWSVKAAMANPVKSLRSE